MKKSQRRIILLCCQNVEQHQTNGKGFTLIPLGEIGIVSNCERFLQKNFAVTGPKEYTRVHILILLHTRQLNSETFEHCTHILTKACSQCASLLWLQDAYSEVCAG